MTSWLVVLNWNGKSDTLALLESVEHAGLRDTTVLVVDNGSTDATVQAVGDLYPWVEILETGENLGFAGGNNRGIEHAIRCGAEVVGLINNDTVVGRGFWEPLVEAASEGSVVVSPDIRYTSSPDESWFYGSVICKEEGWVRHLQPFEQPSRAEPVGSVTLTGCCMVASAAAWRQVGPFDEGLYLICEDVDWSFRGQARGIRLLLEPSSIIYHKVSRSFQGSTASLGLYYFCRNGLVVAARWMGIGATLRFAVHHVVRPGLAKLLRREPNAYHEVAIRLLAIASATLARRGPAGRVICRLAGATAPRGRSLKFSRVSLH